MALTSRGVAVADQQAHAGQAALDQGAHEAWPGAALVIAGGEVEPEHTALARTPPRIEQARDVAAVAPCGMASATLPAWVLVDSYPLSRSTNDSRAIRIDPVASSVVRDQKTLESPTTPAKSPTTAGTTSCPNRFPLRRMPTAIPRRAGGDCVATHDAVRG